MQPSLEKLHKYFNLEAKRRYDNHAVVGGLDKILQAWESDARADNLPEEMIRAVISTLDKYPSQQPEERVQTLKDLWQFIQTGRKGGVRPFQPAPNKSEANSSVPPPAVTRKQFPEPHQTRKTREILRHESLPVPPSRSFKKIIGTGDTGNLGLNAPLTVIQGIGPQIAKTLETLGLHNLRDLLYYFPRRYNDYSSLKPINRLVYGEVVTVIGTIQNVSTRQLPDRHLSLTEAILGDGTGSLRLTWFNQPWIANQLRPGMPISVSGKINQYLGRLMISNPAWDPIAQEQINTNRIVPVYRLTAGISQQRLGNIIKQFVSYGALQVDDYLPSTTRQAANLMGLSQALVQAHSPDSAEQLKAACERLAFDEIFMLQLGVLQQKLDWQSAVAKTYTMPEEWYQNQLSRLPYQLTGAQLKTMDEIRTDLASGHPMNRLIQGDVGSGKTVVAALAMSIIACSGAQAAFMAPTSILAEQHYRTLLRLLAANPEDNSEQPLDTTQIKLLLGDTPEAEKETIREGLADGTIKIVVGTHALIEDPISFSHLQLVVVDEQHRFGVEQRAALRLKGENPHLLVMTATPIPRSLALTVYGDLDLSVMDEMPAGRQIIETHILYPSERERAYSLIKSEVNQGHQAFIIYPLIEQGENEEVPAAVEEHARMQKEIFPHLQIGLLHGRLKPEEKDEVMKRFRDNQNAVLVSTSVVEVGVDVPNATVMLVEGANRFGLAQLHQFRGRVGRGDAKSYCLLIPENEGAAENERLYAMAETNDGFVLAQKDLEQRGPGDFLGTRQSGFAELEMATLSDIRLIEKARVQAQAIFNLDPYLVQPEHEQLAIKLKELWRKGKGDVS
ncbi:MAG: ATP-dependent DNA helicase RecG [Chloroflexi bacterium]|nr:ATP-dependent DNA helicase RecG [Chloroflexota bacterium]